MHERSASNTLTTLCNVAVAFAAGALVMYLVDPRTGRKRRAIDPGPRLIHWPRH